ncbi:unnamed protein product [Rotaria sordida]|uniref:Mitochondrial assembly of ribosomal large subunit protein 1 n=1 Tax=Rotaria sordida TaxID=392033 RepID=A0A814WZ84_9BILA|nr:unnamed protein product [Rotaria sordida]CAF1209054.1 unnamed protein product [Rotaria sordida]CAF3615498.1 unnamed protein product [Rotaria sordida]
MLRLIPSFIRQSSFLIYRSASRSSNSRSHNEPRVRLHPGNQYTIEEIAQNIHKEHKHEIEKLYEFQKLEINNQPSTRDEYRHHINQKKGVFDLDDIVQILRDEHMKDICVIEISPEQQYARYLILATAFSARHLKSTSDYINKLYKAKKKPSDPYLSNECRDGTRWHAMDMGHLVLHLMDAEMREQNDLETLWCVGPKYDDQVHTIQQLLDAIKKMDEQLKEEEVLTVADKYGPLDNPYSHVRYPLEGPGLFQDPPSRKHMTLGNLPHQKM